jgi:ribosomal-protein-alanine N-acetyltransferase
MTEFAGWQPGMPLQLKTERFHLRSLVPEDADDTYTSWWNDEEIQRGFNSPARNWDTERAAKHIRQFNNKNRFHLGIFPKDTNQLIGFFAMLVNYRPRVAKTNVLLGNRDYWGKGVVLEVRARLLEFLFERLQMEKVAGEILGRNLSSIYNYKAMGFRAEGVQRSHILAVSGGRADVYHFGMLREEWKALSQRGGKDGE